MLTTRAPYVLTTPGADFTGTVSMTAGAEYTGTATLDAQAIAAIDVDLFSATIGPGDSIRYGIIVPGATGTYSVTFIAAAGPLIRTAPLSITVVDGVHDVNQPVVLRP